MGEVWAHGAYLVGYAVHDLASATGDGTPLTVAVWYPTAAKSQPFLYGGPTVGQVDVDAKPLRRPGGYPLLVFSHSYGGSAGELDVIRQDSMAFLQAYVEHREEQRDQLVRHHPLFSRLQHK